MNNLLELNEYANSPALKALDGAAASTSFNFNCLCHNVFLLTPRTVLRLDCPLYPLLAARGTNSKLLAEVSLYTFN